MSLISMLVEKYPIRKSSRQKEDFRTWFVDWAQEQGYSAQAETSRGLFRSTNVVVGNPETAQVIFTAHYDTPAVMPLPNFITPCNVPVYLLYQLLLVPFLLLPGAAIGTLAGVLAGVLTKNPELGGEVGGLLCFIMIYVTLGIMMLGPANQNNVNDNSSGVAAVMELMQRMAPDMREKVAFILFDNEEKGLLGSSAYSKAHKAIKKNKLIINMDCVGDGENILFFANKRTRSLVVFPKLEEAMAQALGRNYLMNRMERCIYPSDQQQFKHGIAVCACKKTKLIGYYCDKIHTKKDTICEQSNLDFLADGLTAFVAKL